MKPKLYVSASVNGVTEIRLQNTHQRRSRGQKTDAESKRWRSLAEKQLRPYFVWRIDVILMRLRYRRAIAVYTAGLEADGEDSLQVRTYQWAARRLGKPKAARAVGNVLSKNPIPIIIPCHRVVRCDGKIGRFVLGTAIKKQLLGLEKTSVR